MTESIDSILKYVNSINWDRDQIHFPEHKFVSLIERLLKDSPSIKESHTLLNKVYGNLFHQGTYATAIIPGIDVLKLLLKINYLPSEIASSITDFLYSVLEVYIYKKESIFVIPARIEDNSIDSIEIAIYESMNADFDFFYTKLGSTTDIQYRMSLLRLISFLRPSPGFSSKSIYDLYAGLSDSISQRAVLMFLIIFHLRNTISLEKILLPENDIISYLYNLVYSQESLTNNDINFLKQSFDLEVDGSHFPWVEGCIGICAIDFILAYPKNKLDFKDTLNIIFDFVSHLIPLEKAKEVNIADIMEKNPGADIMELVEELQKERAEKGYWEWPKYQIILEHLTHFYFKENTYTYPVDRQFLVEKLQETDIDIYAWDALNINYNT